MKNVTRSVQRACLLLAAILSGAPATVVFAQSEEGSDRLEEVIVTAQRREQPLQSLAMGITAISGEAIDAMGAETFMDFARIVPGMSFNDTDRNAPGRGQNLTIRGVSTNAGGNDFTTPTVATYLDEVPIPSFFAPEPIDLARVEVLRGPQGTLYGSDALGGAVRFITNKPDLSDFSGRISSTLSQTTHSDDLSYRMSAIVNAPIVENKSALRVAAGYQSRAGWTDNDAFDPLNLIDGQVFTADDVNKLEFSHVRSNLLFELNDRLKINLLGLYEKRLLNGAGQYDPSRPGIVQTGHFSEEPNERETAIGSATIEYSFDSFDFVSATSYYSDETSITLEISLLNRFILGDVPAGFPDFTGSIFRRPGIFVQNNNTRVTTQEFRVVSTGESDLTWLAGFYFSDLASDGQSPLIQEELGAYFNFGADTELTQYAVYGELGYSMANTPLEFTVGARVFRNEFRDNLDDFGSDATDQIFRFSASYNINESALLYGLVSQGFRVGGANQPVPNAPPDFPLQYESDSITNYETGIKSTFRDGKYLLNVSVFFIDWTDIQLQVESGGFLFIDNAGKATSSGVEAEFVTQLTDSFHVMASLTFLKAEIDEDLPNFTVPLVKGDRLPGTPEWAASLAVWKDFRLGADHALVTRLDWQYRDDSLANFDEVQDGLGNSVPRAKLDAYHNVNLRAEVANEVRGWRVALFVKNLLDERPAVGVNRFNTAREFFTIQPRTVGLSASFDF